MAYEGRNIPNDNVYNNIKNLQNVIFDDRIFDVLVNYIRLCYYENILNEFGEQTIIKILVKVNPSRYRAESVNEIIANPPMNRSIKENIDCTGGYTYTSDSSENISEIDTSLSIFMQWIFTGKLKVRILKNDSIDSLLFITSTIVNSTFNHKVLSCYRNYIDQNQINIIEQSFESDNSISIEEFNNLWDQGIDLSNLSLWKDPSRIEFKI